MNTKNFIFVIIIISFAFHYLKAMERQVSLLAGSTNSYRIANLKQQRKKYSDTELATINKQALNFLKRIQKSRIKVIKRKMADVYDAIHNVSKPFVLIDQKKPKKSPNFNEPFNQIHLDQAKKGIDALINMYSELSNVEKNKILEIFYELESMQKYVSANMKLAEEQACQEQTLNFESELALTPYVVTKVNALTTLMVPLFLSISDNSERIERIANLMNEQINPFWKFQRSCPNEIKNMMLNSLLCEASLLVPLVKKYDKDHLIEKRNAIIEKIFIGDRIFQHANKLIDRDTQSSFKYLYKDLFKKMTKYEIEGFTFARETTN